MNNRNTDQVLALAGIFQAARLVQLFARGNRVNNAAFTASVDSIFMIDAANTLEIYGGINGLTFGLQLLRDKLSGEKPKPSRSEGEPSSWGEHTLSGGIEPRDLEVARYVIALIQLEAALRRRPEVAQTLRAGIEAIEAQRADFESTDDADNIVSPILSKKLAELYSQTLSTLTPRIMVSGDPKLLADSVIAANIRTVLLAGIRSAVLWHQFGGNRWQLLFGRKKLAVLARTLLSRQSVEHINR